MGNNGNNTTSKRQRVHRSLAQRSHVAGLPRSGDDTGQAILILLANLGTARVNSYTWTAAARASATTASTAPAAAATTASAAASAAASTASATSAASAHIDL